MDIVLLPSDKLHKIQKKMVNCANNIIQFQFVFISVKSGCVQASASQYGSKTKNGSHTLCLLTAFVVSASDITPMHKTHFTGNTSADPKSSSEIRPLVEFYRISGRRMCRVQQLANNTKPSDQRSYHVYINNNKHLSKSTKCCILKA